MQSNTQTNHDQHLAHEWGLSVEDWTRYRELMQGPLGTYSPNLDPLTALGIEARSDEERRRFAEMQVHAEASRTEKILSYRRAYDAAWQRAFPNAQRISLPDTHVSTVSGNGRLALFVICSSGRTVILAMPVLVNFKPREVPLIYTWSAVGKTIHGSDNGLRILELIQKRCETVQSPSTTMPDVGLPFGCPGNCLLWPAKLMVSGYNNKISPRQREIQPVKFLPL